MLSPQARLVFAGTPALAATILRALLDAGYHVVGVLTAPDRPAGRGLSLQASPVKAVAEAADIPVLCFPTLKTPEAQAAIAAWSPDVMIVAAYGYLLPAAVLAIPILGCVNVHASLLPRWRGAAPIQRAILAGDTETGISIMQMTAGLDTGPVAGVYPLSLRGDETGTSLMADLATLGAQGLLDCLARWQSAPLSWIPQPDEGASYAHKIDKSDYAIDWSSSAIEIHRRIRAFSRSPGASTRYGDHRLKIHEAICISEYADTIPGMICRVTPGGIYVSTGAGVLCLRVLQKPGGRALPVDQFLRGFPIQEGSLLSL